MQNQSYISHHGIKGQRWGRRNGPPYPLGVEDHSSSEKKANWMDSLDSKSKKRLAKQINKDTNREHKGYPYGQDKVKEIPEIKRVFDDLSEARKEYREAHKLSEEFNNLPDNELLKYQNKAYKYMCEKYTGEKFRPLKKNDSFRWEDWDQGDHSSYDIFCRERGSSAEGEWDKEIKARKSYEEVQGKAVNALLGEYGKTKVKGLMYDRDVEYIANLALHEMLRDDEERNKYYTNV